MHLPASDPEVFPLGLVPSPILVTDTIHQDTHRTAGGTKGRTMTFFKRKSHLEKESTGTMGNGSGPLHSPHWTGSSKDWQRGGFSIGRYAWAPESKMPPNNPPLGIHSLCNPVPLRMSWTR